MRQEVEQQRRGDVVGQVADDAGALWQRTEIEFERVRDMHLDSLGREPRREVAVDLDRLHVRRALEQRARQHALPRPDLHDGVLRRGRDRLDDSAHDARVVQEMLPEALARAVPSDARA